MESFALIVLYSFCFIQLSYLSKCMVNFINETQGVQIQHVMSCGHIPGKKCNSFIYSTLVMLTLFSPQHNYLLSGYIWNQFTEKE